MPRKRIPVSTISLVSNRDPALGFALFTPTEQVNVTADQELVIVPSDKGHGWELHIYERTPVEK
jgi:hypothetical protein